MAGIVPVSPRERHARPILRRAAVWFGLVGGGVAWLLHLLLAYVVAEFGCLSGLGETRLAGLTVVAWLLLAVSVFALALAAAAIVTCIRIRKRLRAAVTPDLEELEAGEFSGRLGLISNLVFALVILVQSVPVFFFLKEC